MFYWIYDIPSWQVAVIFTFFFVGVTWFGLIFLAPFFRVWVRKQPGLNDVVGYYLSYFSVLYGLLLGLLSVATYQNLGEVEKTVVKESSCLAALYRDVSAYPEPKRRELQDSLREYTRLVIEDSWPLQQRGLTPVKDREAVWQFQTKLIDFEPQTKGQEILHGESLRQYNAFVEARRMRVYTVGTGIPSIMWYTVVVGAIVNLIFLWLFELKWSAKFFLSGLLAFYLGTVICLIAVMDQPFRGEMSVSAEAFKALYDGIMKR